MTTTKPKATESSNPAYVLAHLKIALLHARVACGELLKIEGGDGRHARRLGVACIALDDLVTILGTGPEAPPTSIQMTTTENPAGQ